jgi:hypothetical protein
MFMLSTSLKLPSGTLLCRSYAYIYALEAGFSQVVKNYKVFCQIIGGAFLTFFPKIKDDNSIGKPVIRASATVCQINLAFI